MDGEVLESQKTANLSIDTLRIFWLEKQVRHNFYRLWDGIFGCDVH